MFFSDENGFRPDIREARRTYMLGMQHVEFRRILHDTAICLTYCASKLTKMSSKAVRANAR